MYGKGCYMMAAGKEATADGSVLVARSCDASGGDDVVQVLAVRRRKHGEDETIRIPGAEGVVLPQVSETYGYLGIMMVIEGFDIAHLSGRNTVGSMVTFLNGKPEKSAYRYFKIRTLRGKVDGPQFYMGLLEETIRV